MNNHKFQNFKEDPFKMNYALVPNLIAAWKYPSSRLKRKVERTKLEQEEAKRIKLQKEPNKNKDKIELKVHEKRVIGKIGDGHLRETSSQNGAEQSIGQNEKVVED